MIGMLGEDKKADWPGHLAEIVHAYKATQSAVTGYSPHHLMFGCRPRLLVNFTSPSLGVKRCPREAHLPNMWTKYVATVHDQLRAALWEAQAQAMAEAQRQKQYYIQKIGAVDPKPGNLVLVQADAFQGKRKIKDRWEDKPHEVVHQIMTDVHSYEVTDQHRQSHILRCN